MKFVKIYVKNSNKFLIVSTKEVPGTENLTEGKQDRNIRKTVYQWQDDKGKSWGCQVLITGESEETIEEYEEQNGRVDVPKLNDSDFRTEKNVSTIAEKRNMKRKRKVKSKNEKIAVLNSSLAILKENSIQNSMVSLKPSATVDTDDETDEEVDITPKRSKTIARITSDSEDDDNGSRREDSNTQSFDNSEKNEDDEQDDRDHESEEEIVQSNDKDFNNSRANNGRCNNRKSANMDGINFVQDEANSDVRNGLGVEHADADGSYRNDGQSTITHENNELNEKCKDLTQKLFKLRNDAKTLSEIAHTYKEKYENLKNQKEKEQVQIEEEDEKKQARGFPEIKCFKSGVKANATFVDVAYAQVKPPMFYQKMCFAVWGCKELSTRCVKKTKAKKQLKEFQGVEIKPMERRKKNAIKKHFVHFLNYYDFGKQLPHLYISEINSYAHRAILSARQRMSTIVENDLPADEGSDNEEIEL